MRLREIMKQSPKTFEVYHGSNATFGDFDKRKAGMGNDKGLRGRGFYFTPHFETAKGYGEHVRKYRVTLASPFNPQYYDTAEQISEELGIDDSIFRFDETTKEISVLSSFAGRFTEALKDAGYDGVVYMPRKEVVAFDPSQIVEIS